LGAVPSAGAAAASAFTAAPPAISGKAPAEAALSGCSVGAFLSGGPYTKSLHGDTRACRQDQHLCTGKPPSLQSRRGSARHTRTHTRGRRVLRRTARGSSPEKWDGREHRHPHDDPAHERRPQHQQHGERPATLLSPRAAVTREQRSGRGGQRPRMPRAGVGTRTRTHHELQRVRLGDGRHGHGTAALDQAIEWLRLGLGEGLVLKSSESGGAAGREKPSPPLISPAGAARSRPAVGSGAGTRQGRWCRRPGPREARRGHWACGARLVLPTSAAHGARRQASVGRAQLARGRGRRRSSDSASAALLPRGGGGLVTRR
jgi:hypothetical protein